MIRIFIPCYLDVCPPLHFSRLYLLCFKCTGNKSTGRKHFRMHVKCLRDIQYTRYKRDIRTLLRLFKILNSRFNNIEA